MDEMREPFTCKWCGGELVAASLPYAWVCKQPTTNACAKTIQDSGV